MGIKSGVPANKQVLGEFVRNARSRVTPQMAGLSHGQRRRTPGLRREEVAQLCDISVTWYTWIEQGRDVSVSSAVWSRLADVLHMTKAERAYLFELAEVTDPDHGKAQHGSLPLSLQACVNNCAGPAYILDRCWNILFFNQALDTVFNHWPSRQQAPNLLRFIFQNPDAPTVVVNWEQRARRSVAEFRADIGAHLDDQDISQIIEELLASSELFQHWWSRQAVVEREGGIREFMHPQKGYLEFEQITFRLATHLDYKLVMLLVRPD